MHPIKCNVLIVQVHYNYKYLHTQLFQELSKICVITNGFQTSRKMIYKWIEIVFCSGCLRSDSLNQDVCIYICVCNEQKLQQAEEWKPRKHNSTR